MSDFVAYFPANGHSQTPNSFDTLDTIYRGPLRVDKIDIKNEGGASLLLTQSFGREPIYYAKEDGSGWIAIDRKSVV